MIEYFRLVLVPILTVFEFKTLTPALPIRYIIILWLQLFAIICNIVSAFDKTEVFSI